MNIPTVTTGRRRIAGEGIRRAATTAAETGRSTPPATVGPAAATDAEQQPDRRSSRPLPAVPARLLAVVGILLAAVVAFDLAVATRLHTTADSGQDGEATMAAAYNAAPAQAEQAAERILSYDVETLQADAAEAKDLLTPKYAATFQKTVDDFLADPASRSQGEVTAKVMASGVISASPAEVEVLLFVDQTTSATGEARTQTAMNRVVLTMVRSGDGWLVDDVTAL